MRINQPTETLYTAPLSTLMTGTVVRSIGNTIPDGYYLKTGISLYMGLQVGESNLVSLSTGLCHRVTGNTLVTPYDVELNVQGVTGGLTSADSIAPFSEFSIINRSAIAPSLPNTISGTWGVAVNNIEDVPMSNTTSTLRWSDEPFHDHGTTVSGGMAFPVSERNINTLEQPGFDHNFAFTTF